MPTDPTLALALMVTANPCRHCNGMGHLRAGELAWSCRECTGTGHELIAIDMGLTDIPPIPPIGPVCLSFDLDEEPIE